MLGRVVAGVEASTWRTSCSEPRAEVAMVAMVRFSASVSASVRNCADSAWARITASEWPTTSCTSRASRACSSRSRAISWACSVSAARAASCSAATWETSDRLARAMNRSARPASHGTAEHRGARSTPAATCHLSAYW